MNKNTFKKAIKNFQFSELFNDLGWDNFKFEREENIKDFSCKLTGIAEKRGFVIIQCNSPESLNYSQRKQLETNVSKLYHEHLIIFTENSKKQQIWQVPIKQFNKPKLIREFEYYTHQEPELLFEKHKGLLFTIDEEENVALVDVISKVTSQFDKNAEKVTKKFYEEFRKEHQAFIKLIAGIADGHHREWYTSLMLNRLMFVYFLQRRGFLSNDPDYLVHKLKEVKELIGKNKFQSFYRDFLLILFHVGLGQPEEKRKALFTNTLHETILGKIPYLNGGLFEVHQIENLNPNISIPDSAFERLFKFFDEWKWHLDTSIKATGKDINPDVLGYIFEKYINYLELQKDAGAYYTKEDITDYISKNCIIPFLFDKVKEKQPSAFKPDGFIWEILYNNPDEYIYEAVKYGIPQVSLDKIELFDNYTSAELNHSAPNDIALPTEIYREVRDRRKRYIEIRKKIENREIADINDFITYNLYIRKFTVDIIANAESSDFINEFYKALSNITILDPTCGSGAFLFAALNILEDLYEECINRMTFFVKDLENSPAKFRKEKLSQFKDVIESINLHPNQQYFIYKTIILRNLYGVDIMNEATEIAKLRLFLKLVATTQPDFKHHNLGLEPLPDIDFNIRAGNTLVGFANYNEMINVTKGAYGGQIKRVDDYLLKCKFAHENFIKASLDNDNSLSEAKNELNKNLRELNEILNGFYAILYSINAINPNQADYKVQKPKFDKWLQTHRPFHWFAEFYEIVNQKGGFDVIIGNPPYVVYSEKNFDYKLKNLNSTECSDLYAYVIEKSVNITHNRSTIGMIIPISLVSTAGFESLRRILIDKIGRIYYSNFSMRPSKLFEGAEKHLTIFVSSKHGKSEIFSSKYHRWYSEEREFLFEKLKYIQIDKVVFHNGSIPKIGGEIELSILRRIKKQNTISQYIVKNSDFKIYHTRKLRYFLQFLDTAPKIYEENGNLRVTSELKELYFKDDFDKNISLSTYLSSLFFWYYITYSDCRNLNKREVVTFPISLDSVKEKNKKKFVNLGKEILLDLQKNSYFQDALYKEYGKLKMQVFQPRQSKPIIDEIDKVLAEHYEFTDEELDFIINYDIKYRLGKDLEDD